MLTQPLGGCNGETSESMSYPLLWSGSVLMILRQGWTALLRTGSTLTSMRGKNGGEGRLAKQQKRMLRARADFGFDCCGWSVA